MFVGCFVFQELTRITFEIDDGTFFDIAALKKGKKPLMVISMYWNW